MVVNFSLIIFIDSVKTTTLTDRRQLSILHNRMEKARSIPSGTNLEQIFWVEVVSTTCYLINRSPTSALVDKIPMKA